MDEKKKVRRKVTPRPKESQGEVPELVLAEEMPVLALRGLVLFPNMILHFDVGREKSVLALNEAINSNRKIFLVAQQDLSADDPGQEELYQVGVVAEARQIIRIQAETLRVLVDGVSGDPEYPLSSRTEGNRLVRLTGDEGMIGQFVTVRITGSNTWALYGEMV